MMKKVVCAGVVLACALAGARPAAAQSREQRQIMAALQILQEQAQQLAITVAALQQSLDQSVAALNGRIDDSANTARKGFADQKLLIDNVANDVRVVRSSSEDTNVRIAALREELEAVRATVLALPQTAPAPPAPDLSGVAPGAAAPAVGSTPSSTPPSTTPPPAASIAGLSPTRMFETARADYFAGQYSVAITGFEQFLKAFPRSELADDAQFTIGEAYFAQNRWQDAIAAYNLTIQTYPNTNAVPDAMYKRGLAQERMGQLDAARASWDAVVRGYPDSDAGRLAKQNLDRLASRRQ